MKRIVLFMLSFLMAMVLAFSLYGLEKKMRVSIVKKDIKIINGKAMIPVPPEIKEWAKKNLAPDAPLIKKLSEPYKLFEIEGITVDNYKKLPAQIDIGVLINDLDVRFFEIEGNMIVK